MSRETKLARILRKHARKVRRRAARGRGEYERRVAHAIEALRSEPEIDLWYQAVFGSDPPEPEPIL